MNEINKIWQKILEIILEKVGESTFELWFSPIKLLDIKNSEAFIEVPNRFFKDWIEDNFPSIISDSFYQITG
ncbi:chromosomal replication initiator protein DnaA, partial [Candidatus Aerophobetes bacterium]|nr:chromosomal replication initiator protein DnaA [Candidatus Aerophobetes bacterium]